MKEPVTAPTQPVKVQVASIQTNAETTKGSQAKAASVPNVKRTQMVQPDTGTTKVIPVKPAAAATTSATNQLPQTDEKRSLVPLLIGSALLLMATIGWTDRRKRD
ncbi:LPXTG cell wall anchor domain-containing protein [Lactiplantibacillus carotarum]|uniref:LPXTG cell wall anchor domain-containing protein n=1 Tax=Lactiplantibacillus carotarum TaxID=2993456 RepID=UPI00298EFE96|nr:LPXTG cell wall anchor domain-containing protein [Lactiplantibacillus carotarum]